MSLPNQLIQSFETIKALPLVQGIVTKESIQAFVSTLNASIPSPLNPVAFSIYRFNRVRYNADKARFVSEIKLFAPYDSMILWTDYKDILVHFGLSNKIFLGWDKINKRYRGYLLDTSSEEPMPPTLDSVEDEMTRIYDYMQMRLASIHKQTN